VKDLKGDFPLTERKIYIIMFLIKYAENEISSRNPIGVHGSRDKCTSTHRNWEGRRVGHNCVDKQTWGIAGWIRVSPACQGFNFSKGIFEQAEHNVAGGLQ